jgi:hypothetical protein
MVVEDTNENLVFINTIIIKVETIEEVSRDGETTVVLYEDGETREYELSDEGHNSFVKAVQARFGALILAGVIDDSLKEKRLEEKIDERVIRAIKVEIPTYGTKTS